MRECRGKKDDAAHAEVAQLAASLSTAVLRLRTRHRLQRHRQQWHAGRGGGGGADGSGGGGMPLGGMPLGLPASLPPCLPGWRARGRERCGRGGTERSAGAARLVRGMMQCRCSAGAVQMQCRCSAEQCSADAAQMQRRCSADAAQMQRRCSADACTCTMHMHMHMHMRMHMHTCMQRASSEGASRCAGSRRYGALHARCRRAASAPRGGGAYVALAGRRRVAASAASAASALGAAGAGVGAAHAAEHWSVESSPSASRRILRCIWVRAVTSWVCAVGSSTCGL